MGANGSEASSDGIALADAITELRRELVESVARSKNEDIRFAVGEVVVEFAVTVEHEKGVSGGVKFWVVNADASGSIGRATTHKLTVPLTPRVPGGGPLLTGRE